MQKRTLGTDLSVSAIGLGCMEANRKMVNATGETYRENAPFCQRRER